MDILFTLTKVFRDVFEDDCIVVTEDSSPDNIADWDSIAQVKLVLMAEMEFGIRFATDEVAGLKTVGDFVRQIQKYLGS